MDWLGQIPDSASIGHFFNHIIEQMTTATFWVAVGRIIWIDMLLSGDNALVIALACRGLPARHRTLGVVLGAGAAVVLRVVFTSIVASLMGLAYLKLVGGLALIVIAAKLVVPGSDNTESVSSASGLWQAVQIIVVADFIMSLDNVIAVAAAANGSMLLLVIGLVVSIPIIVAGAALIMMLLSRLPILVWAGAALLGWIAGTVIASDPALAPTLHGFFAGSFAGALEQMAAGFGLSVKAGGVGDVVMGLGGIVVVLVVGYVWRRRVLHEAALEASRQSAGDH